MFNYFRQFRLNPDKKRLVENFLSLSTFQIANYLLPLITFPYLVRVLGPEKFGLITFAQAFIQYFVFLTDYGFNLSATREISIHRNDKVRVSQIFSAVITIKFLLMAISFLLLLIITFFFNKFHREQLVYLFAFGMVIGQMLFPVWFFQGIERMKYIPLLNILAKSVFTITVFVFIREVDHYLYVPLLNTLGFILAGSLGFWLSFRLFGINFVFPTFPEIKFHLKDGWYIFVSQISTTFFTTSNTFILGILTNNTFVGYYSAGEKLIRALVGLSIPVSNSIFPYISKQIVESRQKVFLFLRKITHLIGSFFLLLSVLIFVFAPQIVKLVLGVGYSNSIIVVKIMAVLPLSIFLNNVFGTQILINLNLKSTFFRILLVGGIINVVLSFILIPGLQHIGSAISSLISELYIAVVMYYFTRKEGFHLMRSKI